MNGRSIITVSLLFFQFFNCKSSFYPQSKIFVFDIVGVRERKYLSIANYEGTNRKNSVPQELNALTINWYAIAEKGIADFPIISKMCQQSDSLLCSFQHNCVYCSHESMYRSIVKALMDTSHSEREILEKLGSHWDYCYNR
jgi:hypothetical protein